MLPDRHPNQQRFPLILYPFAVIIFALCGIQAVLAEAGIIKPPPPNDHWKAPPW